MLGHFRVERMLGSGGMGAVYEAVDEQLERQVALEVLLRDGDSALNQKRFLREAWLAAKLTHPNIATVFEVGELESHLYIVMELLEGQSLRKLLMTQRLKPDETFGIARDIARALARAHAAGITHRGARSSRAKKRRPRRPRREICSERRATGLPNKLAPATSTSVPTSSRSGSCFTR